MSDERERVYCDDDLNEVEEGEEWHEGQCDNCSGYVPDPGAPSLTPACACAVGVGAGPGDCVCGPGE